MSHIDREQLQRYLSGEASPEDAARVEAWLAEDPGRWGELAKLDDEKACAALGQAEVERAGADTWARLRKDVGDEAQLGELRRLRQPHGTPRFSFSSSRWTTGLQVAAALVIAAGAGTAMAVWLGSRQAASAPAVRVAATGAGERATFRLSDGTGVMLGVASTLRYPANFGEDSREVSVEGEAYFDVIHDARRPFVVHAGQLVAKDLGTQFTVRLYPGDPGARVVVREGRVAIRALQGTRTTVVAPGQQGRLALDGAVALTTADTTAVFAWLMGRLVLRSVPLRDALSDLGRWFDLEFRLANSGLGDIPLTVSLTSQPTPATLRTLAAALGLELSQQDRIVTLRAARPER
jgi:ferric-dicitrate binding protein FerR (iron transport regulator)